MTIFVKNKHTLEIEEFKFKCCIGKRGTTSNKKEGDKKTPKGTFKIGNLYYRKDRQKKPSTILKCIGIKKKYGYPYSAENLLLGFLYPYQRKSKDISQLQFSPLHTPGAVLLQR